MNSDNKEGPSPQSSIFETKMTRRSFLEKAAKAAAIGFGVFTGVISPQDTRVSKPQPEPESKEPLKQLPPHVVMVDFAPNGPREGIKQTEFPQEDRLIKSLAEDEYVDEQQLVSEFGPDFRTNRDKQDELFKKYPKMAIMYGALDRFGSHGEYVAFVMQAVWKQSGYKSMVNISPLQNTLDSTQIEVTQDELRNKGFFFTVDHQRIIDALKQYPNQKIVNFSFQVGKVGFFVMEREKRDTNVQWDIDIPLEDENGNELVYVGAKGVSTVNGKLVGVTETGESITPMTQEQYEEFRKKRFEEAKEVVKVQHPYASIKGAYSKEDAEANLPKLFEICNAFPDKLFFAAAGNEGEDLRAILNRPANLLIIAEWDGSEQRPQHKVYGADLYVNNGALYLSGGSSISTPVVSAFASILLNQGLGMDEIKQRLRSATETVGYNAKDGEETASVFTPKKLNL